MTLYKNHAALRELAARMFVATGSETDEAKTIADHLVEANLAGHDSHGIGLLPMYMRDRRAGKVIANRRPELLRDDGAIGIFDAGMGYGHVAARDVTEWAIERAAARGLSLVALRNAYHVARLGSYAEQAIAQGLIAILFVNVVFGSPRVAPFGGAEGRLHTNPICIGIPCENPGEPFLLDFATSRMAIGKVRVAYEESRPLPPGVLIDSTGAPTTNPAVLYEEPMGAILSFGEHKGYGLAVACELLAGALTGGVTNTTTSPADRGLTNSMLGIFIDPCRFADLPVFQSEIGAILAHLRASPPTEANGTVLIAGEPERIARNARLARGIPIAVKTWSDIVSAALLVGVSDAGPT